MMHPGFRKPALLGTLLAVTSGLVSPGVLYAADPAPGPSKKQASEVQEARYFRTALSHFQKSNYAKSRAYLTYLVRHRPQNALYWFNLGNTCFKQQDYQRAAAAYEKVVQLKSSLLIPARLYQVKAYRKLQDTEHAFEALAQLPRAGLPANLSSEIQEERTELKNQLLKLGIRAYQQGDYPEAIQLLNRSLAVEPSSQAYLMLGLSFSQEGRFAPSEIAYQRSLESTSDEELRNEAQRLLSLVRTSEKEKRSPQWMNLSTGGGYNSNFYGDSEADPSGAGAVILVSAAAGGQYLERKPYSFKASYDLYWESLPSVPSEQFVRNTLSLPAQYQRANWFLQAAPRLQYELKGSHPYQLKPGAGLTLERRIGRNYYGASLNHTWYKPQDPSFAYLGGFMQTRRLYWNHQRATWFSMVSLLDSTESISSLQSGESRIPLGNRSTGPALGIFFLPHPSWEMDASASLLFRSYVDRAQPGNLARQDRQWNASLRVSRTLLEKVKSYASIDFVLNRSSMDSNSVENKNYRQWIAMAGLSWDVIK